jgi:hypothetical protein
VVVLYLVSSLFTLNIHMDNLSDNRHVVGEVIYI